MKRRKFKGIWKFLVGILIAPLFYYFLSILVFFIKTGDLKSSYLNQEIYQYLNGSFSEKYEVEILEEKLKPYGPPSLIVYANDKNYHSFCSMENLESDQSLLSPTVRIYDERKDIFSQLGLEIKINKQPSITSVFYAI